SGIALGLLGDGPLWVVGGMILLIVGSHDVLTLRGADALFTSGRQQQAVSKPQMIVAAIASAVASVVFLMLYRPAVWQFGFIVFFAFYSPFVRPTFRRPFYTREMKTAAIPAVATFHTMERTKSTPKAYSGR